MKTRKLLHIAAIVFSSVASLLTHGSAKAETAVKKAKKNGGEISKLHRSHKAAGDAADNADDAPPAPHKAKAAAAGTPKKPASTAQRAQTPDHTVRVGNLVLHHATGDSAKAAAQQESAEPPKKLDPALMASAERSTPPPAPLSHIAPASASETVAAMSADEASRYPWRREIVTTTFWIGENSSKNNPVPNHASSWDPKWTSNYGGSDEPDTAKRTSEYTPAAFTPGQNPFYIALPYNDMEHGAHKLEASKVIPWFYKDYKGPTKSVCKGRWLAIRHGNKVCYAQWEDAGPFRTDHWEYVFGNERPRPNLNRGAGLDVSPAVRDYLGMNGSDVTDWKFVDFDEVPAGPWAKFGENNTFVQNARKSGTAVAQMQESKAKNPVTLRDLTTAAWSGTNVQ